MNEDQGSETWTAAVAPRRRTRRNVLTAAVLAPTLTGIGRATALAPHHRSPVEPKPTTEPDWREVARVLGRDGAMIRAYMYATHFLREDLRVVSQGVTITPDLALGSHVGFVRYADGSTLVMGDMVVTEEELQPVADALHAHGLGQTALHKHLLAQDPDVWWTHVHAHGHDPVALARGVRAALNRTGTRPPAPSEPPPPLDLDTEGIDAALGCRGAPDGRVYRCTWVRRETVVDHGLALPAGLGATTALSFQPLGGGRAALSGDFAMVAEEVQGVLATLRRGGIDLVTLHSHGLREEPRLFFVHLWAVGDAVTLAQSLRPAVDMTNITEPARDGGSTPAKRAAR